MAKPKQQFIEPIKALIFLSRLLGCESDKLWSFAQNLWRGLHGISKLVGMMDAGTQARLRTAIVTGASRGIGAGVTRAFLDLGYHVVANALHFADSKLAPNGTLP